MRREESIADLKQHGPGGWALFLCSVGLASAFLPPSVIATPSRAPISTPIGPLVEEAPFTKIEPSGTGCPLGSYLLLWDGEGVLQNLKMIFEEFEVETRGHADDPSHKYCEILVNINYPLRYGLTVEVTRMDGRAYADEGVTAKMYARLSTERQGIEDKAPVDAAWTKIERKGDWFGYFSEVTPLKGERLVLPCGLKRPLVFRIIRAVDGRGRGTVRSFIIHEFMDIPSEVHVKLHWRHCP